MPGFPAVERFPRTKSAAAGQPVTQHNSTFVFLTFITFQNYAVLEKDFVSKNPLSRILLNQGGFL
jgi:hypothetical protein